MWGIGKKRSEVGKFLDKHRYTQEELKDMSKVNRNTVSKICSDSEYVPSGSTMKKILKALRELDPAVKMSDFWDM